jgi:hypothetical protein
VSPSAAESGTVGAGSTSSASPPPPQAATAAKVTIADHNHVRFRTEQFYQNRSSSALATHRVSVPPAR